MATEEVNNKKYDYFGCVDIIKELKNYYEKLNDDDKRLVLRNIEWAVHKNFSDTDDSMEKNNKINDDDNDEDNDEDTSDGDVRAKRRRRSIEIRARPKVAGLTRHPVQVELAKTHIQGGRCCFVNFQFFMRCDQAGVVIPPNNHAMVKKIRARCEEVKFPIQNFTVRFCRDHYLDKVHHPSSPSTLDVDVLSSDFYSRSVINNNPIFSNDSDPYVSP